jgi:hypothetical protein
MACLGAELLIARNHEHLQDFGQVGPEHRRQAELRGGFNLDRILLRLIWLAVGCRQVELRSGYF